jgi:phosphatidate cytidylyltransferase
MTTFQQRALTAVIFAAVMLVGLFWNETSFLVLFFIISLGCLWEFLGMLLEKSTLRKTLGMALGISLCLVPLSISFFDKSIGSWNLNRTIDWGWDISNFVYWIVFSPLIFAFFICPILLLIVELFLKGEKPFQNVGAYLVGIFYTIVPFFLYYLLSRKSIIMVANSPLSPLPQEANYESNFTPYIVAGTLFLIWANDTFAYLIGSKIGKTPLLPRISPKKTWEGTIGGALMCMLTGVVISYFFKELTLINWMIVGAIVATFGTLGDLIESMLKRSVGVKDSGSFMPGHGGFLDRFDAFIFAVPFVYLYLIVLK